MLTKFLHLRVAALAAATAFTALPAYGQALISPSTATAEAPVTDVPERDHEPGSPVRYSAGAAVTYRRDFQTDLRRGATGTMAGNHTDTQVTFGAGMGVHDVRVRAGYRYDGNEFRGGQAPFGNTQFVGTMLSYTGEYTEEWGAFGIVGGGLAAETAANLSDGKLFTVSFGPSYRFSENLKVFAGPMFRTRLEDNNKWTPIAGVEWQIDKQWSLRTYNGATLAYDVFEDRKLVLELRGEYQTDQFRLRDQPGQKRALVTRAVRAGVAATYQFTELFYVRTTVDGVFLQKYQFRINGGSANNFDADATPSLSIQVGARF